MLDYFSIFTFGGSVLWEYEWNKLSGSPVNALIEQCLIEERAAKGKRQFSYTADSVAYTLKWEQNNKLGLVFVAVYRAVLSVPYVDQLLKRVKNTFEYVFDDGAEEYPEFAEKFQEVLARCEAEQAQMGGGARGGVSDEDDEDEDEVDSEEDAVLVEKPMTELTLNDDDDEAAGDGGEDDGGRDGAFDTSKLKAKLRKRGKSTMKKAGPAAAAVSSKPSERKGRKWGRDGRLQAEEGDAEALDYTSESQREARYEKVEGKSMMDEDSEDEYEVKETGWLGTMMKKMNISGNASLASTDVKPILETLKEKLIGKNVAEEVAQKIVDSVESNMIGKKLESFTRVTTAVTKAVEDALTKILSPGRNINILQEVEASRREGEPYSIVFIGCNGVGKSTNLAKVAFWLMQHGMKVMIAACDTFRSGAVEQLRTHTQRLGVELFEKGYEKDPANVAREALKKAKENGCDVLLVDTAGRMQDNEPLMRALSKLINMNNPNLTLFVGEALVGNEAVDQLTKFNSRLIELSPQDPPHRIDGIVLTKFDTIDNKVGAALSMVYISGAPVIFVGCGQTYSDLRRLNVKQIVSVLLE